MATAFKIDPTLTDTAVAAVTLATTSDPRTGQTFEAAETPSCTDISDDDVNAWLDARGVEGPFTPDFIDEIRGHIGGHRFLELVNGIRRDQPARMPELVTAYREAGFEELADAIERLGVEDVEAANAIPASPKAEVRPLPSSASPAIVEAFNDWRTHELAGFYAQPCPDELMDKFLDAASRASIGLASIAPRSAEDLALQMVPLMLELHEADSTRAPFPLKFDGPQSGVPCYTNVLWETLLAALPSFGAVIDSTSERSSIGRLPAAASIVVSKTVSSEQIGGADAEIIAAWDRRQQALAQIEQRGTYYHAEDHSPAEAEVFDLAEMVIHDQPATTLRAIAAKLWVALSHCGTEHDRKDRKLFSKYRHADMAALEPIARDLDFVQALIYSAIQGLAPIVEQHGHRADDHPQASGTTTAAVRDFLAVGGRILIDPQGKLAEGGEVPDAFASGTDNEAAEALRASRVYFDTRRRGRSEPQIKRAVRMLGRSTNNGWRVLEADHGRARGQL